LSTEISFSGQAITRPIAILGQVSGQLYSKQLLN
jgi:hypothetical protein